MKLNQLTKAITVAFISAFSMTAKAGFPGFTLTCQDVRDSRQILEITGNAFDSNLITANTFNVSNSDMIDGINPHLITKSQIRTRNFVSKNMNYQEIAFPKGREGKQIILILDFDIPAATLANAGNRNNVKGTLRIVDSNGAENINSNPQNLKCSFANNQH